MLDQCQHALGPGLQNNSNLPALYYEGQWVGHFPLLLPYLEQDALLNRLDIIFDIKTISPRKWFWTEPATGPGIPHAGNYRVAMSSLNLLLCPSVSRYTATTNNPAPRGGGTVLGFHVFNDPVSGPFTAGWRDEYGSASSFRPLGKTHYMGVAGCGTGSHPVYGKFQGIYTNRVELSLGQISSRDGTSNTLLYGETTATRWQGEFESEDISWMAGGGLGTYLGLGRSRTAILTQFSGWHPNGVLFCFADGSVRIIRYGKTQREFGTEHSHDWYLLQELAGYRDGMNSDVSSILD